MDSVNTQDLYHYNGIINEEMKSLLSGEIILCHGSDHIIEEPLFGVGNAHNDYGLGFYCTRHEELAKEWAVSPFTDGYANRYRLVSSGLRILDLNRDGHTILDWLSILLENRIVRASTPLEQSGIEYLKNHFRIPNEDYDVLVGYRADDSYFSFARDFLRGTISVQKLKRLMHLGDLGNQVVIRSEEAFKRLEFLDAVKASKEIFYPARQKRDLLARNSYMNMQKGGFDANEIYLLDIIREGMGHDDPRLR